MKYKKLILAFIIGLFATIIVISCSEDGSDDSNNGSSPVLSSVKIEPDTVAAGLTITLSGNFSFSDLDADLNDGSFNYTYEGKDYSFILPEELNGLTSGIANFSLQVVISSSTGSKDIPCWLVDKAGNKSNTFYVSLTQLWTRQFGTTLEDIGYGLAVDNSDNVLVAGITHGDLDGETNLGASDVFITKYASNTTRVWTRLVGSSDTDYARGVAIDSNNNIYVTGFTNGTSFDGQTIDAPSAGFLTKFDTSGNRVWTQLISTSVSSSSYAVITDSSNNIYVTGRTTGDLDGETNAGSYDIFIVKFDINGSRLWTRLLGTTSSETAYGITIDKSDNVYLTGSTEGVLGIDPSPGDPSINADVFIAKYDSSGILDWVSQLGTSGTEWGKGIAVDVNGNINVVGKIYFLSFPDNSANGGYDAFIARLDADGNTQWIRQFGTTDHDSANSVITDSVGNAYITGYLDSAYFTDDNEGHNIILAKYDNSGTQVWVVQDNGGYNWGNQGLSVAMNSVDNIFLTGTIQGRLDGHIKLTYGEDDVFILKYDTNGTRR